MKIIDCFNYFDEDLILDARLNIMNNYVDYFVIVESTYNHNGERRELKFDLNTGWVGYTHRGRSPAGVYAVKWAQKVADLGAVEILLTSMDSDGHESGYDLELLSLVSSSVSIPVIASGGAGSLEHLQQAIEVGKADAVLAASIFHFGTYSIGDAKTYLANRNIAIRPLGK